MTLKLSKIKDEFIDNLFEECMNELKDFFKINWTKNRPSIILFEDRETLDELKGSKTDNWNVGFATNNKIYLLNRENYEKESCHKYSDEEYKKLLKHELVHLYYDIFSRGAHYPRWFDEGLAVFLSGQLGNKNLEKFEKFLDYFEKRGDNLYTEGGFAIKILIENFGQEKIFELIKNISSLQTEEKFNLKFKEIYGEKPSYEFFNSLINNQKI
jgi:hypothetical protein